jgi:hypothetical protein
MVNTTLSDVDITLSTKRLGNSPRNMHENDFTFIVGESYYHYPRICISREFVIETDDSNHSFAQLLNVCYGSSFQICENVSFLRSICCEVNNLALDASFENNLTTLNAFDRANVKLGCISKLTDLTRKQFFHCHLNFFHESFQMIQFD